MRRCAFVVILAVLAAGCAKSGPTYAEALQLLEAEQRQLDRLEDERDEIVEDRDAAIASIRANVRKGAANRKRFTDLDPSSIELANAASTSQAEIEKVAEDGIKTIRDEYEISLKEKDQQIDEQQKKVNAAKDDLRRAEANK